MPVPLVLHFSPQLERVLEGSRIKARVRFVSTRPRHVSVGLGRYFRRKMRASHQQVDDLLLVLAIEQPALSLNVSRQISLQNVAMFARPLAEHKSAKSLVRPDELQRGTQAYEALALGHDGTGRAQHGA